MDNEYNIIFIVLVYRNTADLEDFFNKNHIDNSKTIVVNSFYDKESECKFNHIAKSNNADFISVPNNGYGAGNNRGIEYALANYSFKYLIISNADITIEKFDPYLLDKYANYIIAPKLLTLKGKNQNPSTPFKNGHLMEYLTYLFYRGNHKYLIFISYILSRLSKILFYSISNIRKTIYSPHGAFFIMPYGILSKLIPIYNENMFLFYEENHFGRLAESLHIKTIYVPDIVIRHKEDGSVAYLSDGIFSHMRNSYLTYYKYWNR